MREGTAMVDVAEHTERGTEPDRDTQARNGRELRRGGARQGSRGGADGQSHSASDGERPDAHSLPGAGPPAEDQGGTARASVGERLPEHALVSETRRRNRHRLSRREKDSRNWGQGRKPRSRRGGRLRYRRGAEDERRETKRKQGGGLAMPGKG